VGILREERPPYRNKQTEFMQGQNPDVVVLCVKHHLLLLTAQTGSMSPNLISEGEINTVECGDPELGKLRLFNRHLISTSYFRSCVLGSKSLKLFICL
jgi:hypothetical protein